MTTEQRLETTFMFGNRPIGPSYPPLIIAELSGNHNGDKARAIALIDAIAAAGAEAVKFQTYTADTITIDHDGPDFLIDDGPWKGRRLHELYQEAHTPWEWHADLLAHARAKGLLPFSSPFDASAVRFLESLDCPAYKIASFECIDTPLIRTAAATGKPLIISTGLADQAEIDAAVAAAREGGASGVALLHCVSAYPAPAEEYNLHTIPALRQRHRVVVGLSDHTLGTATAVAACALGASIIEKHVTLARADGGPDSGFSLEPDELARLIEDCKTAWQALGGIRQDPTEAEKGNVRFRRSLYAVRDIAEGELFSAENVRSIRPGYGLPPSEIDTVIGRRAQTAIARGTPLNRNLIVGTD